MMRRATLVAGVAAVLLAGAALPAQAGDKKKLPKAKPMVESIRPANQQTHYVRTVAAKPAPQQSPVLRVDRDVNQTHYIREGPEAR